MTRQELTINKLSGNLSAWLAAAAAGLFAGFMMLVLSVTYTSLIFTGQLGAYLPLGLVFSICSIVIVGLAVTFFSSSPHLVVQIDDDTAPVFSILLTFVLAGLPLGLSQSALFTNVAVTLFVASGVTGLMMALFGYFKFGRFIQFLPYSVMGGYFAAVGWLILAGSIEMLAGIERLFSADLSYLFRADILVRWLPSVLVGVFMRVLSARFGKGPVLSITVIAFTLVFYLVSSNQGVSSDWLMANHFLIGPFTDIPSQLVNPISSLNWGEVDWAAISSNAGSIASIVLISLLSIILCINAVSLTTQKDLSLDSELKVAGVANIVAACSGGLLALPSVSITKLSYEINQTETRIKGVVAALVALTAFYLGMDALAYIPKMVLGALLIYIGLGFAHEWLIKGYRKFGPLEYCVIPIILVVSLLLGFLQAVLVGIIAAIVLFAIKYSQVKVVRYEASGADLHSNLSRDRKQSRALDKLGHRVRVFQLQGFLFFGTMGSLYQRVMDVVNDPDHASLKYVILDFSKVIGVDSSATLNLERLAQRLTERNIYLLTDSLKADVLDILRRGGLRLDANDYLTQHSDLDHALEWCEEQLLHQADSNLHLGKGLFERLAESLPDYENVHLLQDYIRPMYVENEQLLMQVGEVSDEVFFLESCTASAYILDSDQYEHRVSGAGRGAIYGEIGFILGIPRTANVRIDSAGELYSLSKASLKKMEHEHPELAIAITNYLAKIVTQRLVNTTNSLRNLL